MTAESTGETSEGRAPRLRLSFRTKLALFGALVAVLPLVASGAWMLARARTAVGTLSEEVWLAVTEDVARSVDASLSGAQDGLDSVGRVLLDERLDPESTERLALALVAGTEALDHAAVYDADGALIDVLRERGADVDMPETIAPELREEAAERGVATGAATPGEVAARVPVVVPLRVGEETSGYAMSLVSLEPVQRRVTELSHLHFGGRPDSPYLVDGDHRLLAHPDGARAAACESVAGRGLLAGIDPGALRPSFRQSGEFEDGERTMLGVVVGMEGRDWGVVAQLPEDVAFASLIEARRTILVVLGLCLLLAVVAALLVARQVTRPIGKLVAFTEDLAERRFGRRVSVQSGDELGLLAHAMSEASVDLAASEDRIREEIAIRADLGRYLPAELVDAVVAREQDMGLGGRRREISVLFADVVAFTPITDRLKADDVVTLLNELFTILTEIVFRHGGTVDKFMGDCVMAIWGAPREQEDHAARALAAAEDMMSWLEAGNAGWEERFGVTIELAIGVNSGEAVVGNVGSETRMEYTAIGDTVNVAARLESIARPGQILATEATRALCEDDFDFRDLGPRELTGRSEPVHLHEVRT